VPIQAALLRIGAFAFYALVLFRPFRHDGRRDDPVTLAVPQRLTRFLAALLGIPIASGDRRRLI
jgi:hypothetical protein